mgnify:CR=1 FL=1
MCIRDRLRAAALKLVVKFPVVPVMSPANVISSLKLIAVPPVFELNASAYTVPVALTLPDTVKASFGVSVPIPTLPLNKCVSVVLPVPELKPPVSVKSLSTVRLPLPGNVITAVPLLSLILLPVNCKSSVYTVPLADKSAVLTLVVKLPVVPTMVGEQTLVAPHTFVPDNKGATAQLLPFNIGVLTLVVPHTRGDNTLVLPHTVAPHTNVVPCTVGEHTLVPPQTNGDERLVVTVTALGKPIVTV